MMCKQYYALCKIINCVRLRINNIISNIDMSLLFTYTVTYAYGHIIGININSISYVHGS